METNMNTSYSLGVGMINDAIRNQINFQNEVIKIWTSAINSNPLTTWMKLITNDILSEPVNLFNPFNRNFYK